MTCKCLKWIAQFSGLINWILLFVDFIYCVFLIVALAAASFRLNDNATGALCLLVDGNFTVTVSGAATVLNSTFVNTSASDCNITAKSAQLVTTFDNDSNLIFVFGGNSTSWYLSQINYTAGNVNAAANLSGVSFTANIDQSYECDFSQSVQFSPNVTLNVSYWRAQAFNFKSASFDEATHCSLDPTPVPPTSSPSPFPTPSPSSSPSPSNTTDSKVVPIAVGAALAGLVIIVLVVYLIGRFKSRKETSYQVLP